MSDEPIQRLSHRFDRLETRLVVLVMGTGALVCLGFIELLRSPLQQLSRMTIELLAVRALLFLAPLLVSLLLLLRHGPQLLGERRPTAPWAPELISSGLLNMVLLLYFMGAVSLTASLTLNEGDVMQELGYLIGQLEPARFVAALAKAAVYGAITATVCLQQSRRPATGPVEMASRMARSTLVVSGVLLGLDLLWTLAIDPLRLGAG